MKSSSPTRSIVIFGGAGFIGSNWAHHLIAKTNAHVHVFDNLSRRHVEQNLRFLQKLAGNSNRLTVTTADVRDERAVARAVQGATEIYHFAAQVAVTTSLDDPRTDFEINAGGTFNILEAARQSGNQPFVLFTSTNKVYGEIHPGGPAVPAGSSMTDLLVDESQPLDFYSPYGCSKGTADQYVHDYARIYGLPTVVFRMSCIAGPRQFGNEDQGWVAHFIYSALRGRPISIYGNGCQVRDVLAVEDLLRAFSAAYENREHTAGQLYNIGGGRANAISLLQLIEILERTLHVRVQHRFRPTRPGDQPVYITDFAKFTQSTQWAPEITVEQIVKDISSWFRINRELFVPAAFPVSAKALQAEISRELAS